MKHPVLLAALLYALPAFAQHKHVHGEGRLDVAVDKDSITLHLELPLDAAVGFERAPKNDKEKAALAAAARVLEAVPFAPSAAAQCTLQRKEVALPFLDGKSHQAAGEHADIDASYVYRCANVAALKSVETTLFKDFKRLYRLETQRVGPGGQGAMRLAPNKPMLVW